jgi:hypothetical protein
MSELVITYGDKATQLAFVVINALLVRFIFSMIDSTIIRRYVDALWDEIRAAVLEVEQTYVSALKLANGDGVLTNAEKAEAKRMAIKIAKANFGAKGLARLARAFGMDMDGWIGNKIEAVIAGDKVPKLISAIAETPPKLEA